MQVLVKPSKLKGVLKAPPSKSMMQRVCAAALLHNGTCLINNIGSANDDDVAIKVIQQLGASVNRVSHNSIEVLSSGILNANNDIHCCESGLSARIFTIITALASEEVTITGSGSLLKRSMLPFEDLFRQLDVTVSHFSGRLPITIKGPLQPKNIRVDGSLSSQFLSGLLIAYAFTAKKEVTISVDNLVSRPYIDMTLEVLKKFGKIVTNVAYETFSITPTSTTDTTLEINIEGDWSSVSFWLVAAAINGNVKLQGLRLNTSQADIAILAVLKETGINHVIEGDTISIQALKGRPSSFLFDATHAPDLFPILSIYAALCNGVSEIKGLHRLKEKESDRAVTIKKMLDCFDVFYIEKDDALFITGQEQLKAAAIDSCNDHRIAMAASIGALNADGSCIINGADAINKSYPNFYKDLLALEGICILDVASSK